MGYPGLPNGGNSMTTQGGAAPQASASAAAFARKKLMAAQAAGLLPGNFNVAHTRQNLIGQFHMLQPQLVHAMNHGGGTADNLNSIMQAIGGLGQNNLMTRGQQGQYGPAGLPNGGNSMPQAPGQMPGQSMDVTSGLMGQLMQMLLGQQQQAQPFYNPSMPQLY